jgi:hypothetical protein
MEVRCEGHSALTHLVHLIDPFSVAHWDEVTLRWRDFGLKLCDLGFEFGDLVCFVGHHTTPLDLASSVCRATHLAVDPGFAAIVLSVTRHTGMMDVGVGACWTCAVDIVVIGVRSVAGIAQAISDALIH